MWLAVGFGVLGVSGIAQATAPVPTVSYPWAWYLKGSLWGVSIIVLVFVLLLIKNLWSVGQVAPQEFENRYKDVRKFLSHASTDRLDTFGSGQAGSPKGWTELDGI